uniref:Uncharacterized protein n=1 Tax=Lepeophtheirus salmonis TaxID=72036 RepID=A0A0K2V6S0_LEPSM
MNIHLQLHTTYITYLYICETSFSYLLQLYI